MKKKLFLATLKSLKKGVGSGADPDPHRNVTDPQHCLRRIDLFLAIFFVITTLIVSLSAGPHWSRARPGRTNREHASAATGDAKLAAAAA
jgi:hypothetical protein